MLVLVLLDQMTPGVTRLLLGMPERRIAEAYLAVVLRRRDCGVAPAFRLPVADRLLREAASRWPSFHASTATLPRSSQSLWSRSPGGTGTGFAGCSSGAGLAACSDIGALLNRLIILCD